MLKNKESGIPFLLLIVLLVISLMPINVADAHSTLEEAKPNDGEQLKDTINSIELTFSTKIENGSTLYLVNDEGEEIEPASVNLADDVLEATFKDSLKPGSYQVNWKIAGADGHIIENQYSFSIEETENNATKTEDDQNSTIIDNNSRDDNKKEAEQSAEKQQQPSKTQTSNDNEQFPLITGIIIFLIITGIALLAWTLFSKRKK